MWLLKAAIVLEIVEMAALAGLALYLVHYRHDGFLTLLALVPLLANLLRYAVTQRASQRARDMLGHR